jgi:hypothetical protein
MPDAFSSLGDTRNPAIHESFVDLSQVIPIAVKICRRGPCLIGCPRVAGQRPAGTGRDQPPGLRSGPVHRPRRTRNPGAALPLPTTQSTAGNLGPAMQGRSEHRNFRPISLFAERRPTK